MHPNTEPLGMPRDPVTPNLEPNLSLEALVSQLERVTTIVRQLESQMDANERSLGDPDAATCLPPAAASNVHQPLRSASHYSAAPVTVQAHINPDIAGSLQQPPTQRSLPCSHDMRYGSIESLADDIDAHESVQSRQIHCYDILSDKLLNRDPIGGDKAKDVIHSSVDRSFTLSNVEASMELIVKEVDSGFGRNGFDKNWKYADNTGEHIAVDIRHCSTTLAADARLIPPRIDTTCLGIPGCVDKLHLWANHKHDAWMGQVEGVYEVL